MAVIGGTQCGAAGKSQNCAVQDCRTSCIYRIAQEGLPLLLPLMTKQVVYVRAEALLRQLTEGSIALPESHRLPMDVVGGAPSMACSSQAFSLTYLSGKFGPY